MEYPALPGFKRCVDLDEVRIEIAERIKNVCFDDVTLSSIGCHPLTSIRKSIKKCGILGENTQISMIDGYPPNKNQYVLPVNLIQRKAA